MAGDRPRNALVIQSGGCTPVLNASLYGVVQEATASTAFDKVYGALRGLEGVLDDRLEELSEVSPGRWRRIARTPGAALGSSRRRLKPGEEARVLENLEKRGIDCWFIIGGNDSAETGHRVWQAAHVQGRPLTVVHVPKTIDNDLALTDHSPGYGSAARFVALATMGAGQDAASMGKDAPITVLEVMGRDAGWLAAASVLGKRRPDEAPHVVLVPEVPVDEGRFLALMEEAYRRFGHAVAVVAENVRGPAGHPLGGQQEPWYVDEFGHPYYESPARYLAALAGRRMGVRARYERPGTIQRSMAACLSSTDLREAEAVGRAAVRYALDGHTDVMVCLRRRPGRRYSCDTGLAPLEQVAGRVKTMPPEHLETERYMVTEAFKGYARPLIGGPLPRFERLDRG